jgi:hypothetical protein
MASTINASTTGLGGIITTGDNSGSLALQTAGTTAVTINSSQVVNFVNTPTVAGGSFGGKVLQVVQSLVTGKSSTTSSSPVKLATSSSITPTSSTSKILVSVFTPLGNADTGNADFTITRTVSGTDTNITGYNFNRQAATAVYQQPSWSWSILDTPSTTSAITYSISAYRTDGNATPFCGGRATDTYYATGTMFILMEIAA